MGMRTIECVATFMPTVRLVTLGCLTWALAAAPGFGQQLKKDLVYGEAAGRKLHLDFALPENAATPAPVVLCIHGGGWQQGHRAAHHRTVLLLAKKGYVGVTMEYRLAPKDKFPAQLEDVRTALRFVRSQAKEWKADPERIALLGDSAGGHLALLTAFAPGGEAKVQAVVNYYGPTDLRVWKATPLGEIMFQAAAKKSGDQLLVDFLGTADRKQDVVARASPLAFVANAKCPILTFQGTNDPLVPDSQARILHDALKKADVPERLELLEGAGHGWGGANLDRTDRIAMEFLDSHLRKKAP